MPVNSPLKGIDEDSIAQTEEEEPQEEYQEFDVVVAQYEYTGGVSHSRPFELNGSNSNTHRSRMSS